MTNKDKKVINLAFQDLKFCENNSLQKDTIIKELETRVELKDSFIVSSIVEIVRLKTNRDSLQKENTKLSNDLRTTKNVINGLVVLLVVDTFIIILK